MAQKLGGRANFPTEIKLFQMKDKPYEGIYQKSEFVSNEKVEGSSNHIFTPIDGTTETEQSIWGFGGLDFILLQNKLTKEVKAALSNGAALESKIEAGTPLRIIYKGLKSVKVLVGKKMITKDIHDVEVYDISDEVAAK
jgi:hypothetical protein